MSGPFYFAWVGDALGEETVLVTTGDTHGGVPASFGTTGEVDAGSTVASHLANTASLNVGSLYGIAGAGIPEGAVFVYEGGDAVTMSEEATASIANNPITITASVSIAETIAALSSGDTLCVLADTASLVSGVTYGLAGEGIALGTFFTYAGSPAVTLSLPATSDETTSPVIVSGLATDTSPFIVDNLASTTGLVPDSDYGIVGPGIPASAGFTFDGADILELDAAATASALLVPLTIFGPRTHDGGAFDAGLHTVEDEDIFALEIHHAEGDFAGLAIDIQNPEVGLLALGRQVWCWLSWDSGAGIVPLFHGRLVGVPENLQDETVRLQFIARPNDYNAQKEAAAAPLRQLPWWDPIWLKEKELDPDTVLETRTMLWHTDRVSLAVTASDIIEGEDATFVFGEADHFYDEMRLSYGQPPLPQVAISGQVSWTQSGSGTVDLTGTIVGAFKSAGSPWAYPLISCLTGDGLKNAWPKAKQTLGDGWTVNPASSLIEATHRIELGFFGPSLQGGWVKPYDYEVKYIAPAPTATGIAQAFSLQYEWAVGFPVKVFAANFLLDYEASRPRTETVKFVLVGDTQRVTTDPGSDSETIELTSEYVGAADLLGEVPIGDLRRNSYFKTDRGALSLQYLMLLGRAKLRARARCVEITFGCEWSEALAFSCRHNVTLIDRRLPGGSATGKIKEYRLIANDQVNRAEVTIACTVGNGGSISASGGSGGYSSGYAGSGYSAIPGSQTLLPSGDAWYEDLTDFIVTDDGLNLVDPSPEEVVLNLNFTQAALSLSTTGSLHQNLIVDNLASIEGLTVGGVYAITGDGIPHATSCTYQGGNYVTLDKPSTILRDGAGVTIRGSAQHGIVQNGLNDQVTIVTTAAHSFTSAYPDPVGALKAAPTRIILDLPSLTASFQTIFLPAVSGLVIPKTIDLSL